MAWLLFLCLALLRPPPVEAVEETPSRGTVIFEFINLIIDGCTAVYDVDFYGDDDYYISSQRIYCRFRTGERLFKRKTVCYNIPAEAKIVVIKDFMSRQAWGHFKLDESSEFSSGCIRAVVECSGVRHFERRSKRIESSGCWKQIQV